MSKTIQNGLIRVSVTVLGGHIAEITDLATGVNPLWVPPWVNEENPDFGNNCETRLLAAIRGHNLCLDLFGPPSESEEAAGIAAHGEAGIMPHEFEESPGSLTHRCVLSASQLAFERTITLEGRRVRIVETIENLSPWDRPIAWTQHVTLGPPFHEPGITEFRFPSAKSHTLSEAYTAHLMDPAEAEAWFTASSGNLTFGYTWRREDFPWMGIWTENRGRTHSPWNGRTVTQGMEFGVSPFPETRRAMIERGTMFGAPCCRWIGAKQKLRAEYTAGFIE